MPTPLSTDLSGLSPEQMKQLIAVKRMEAAGMDPMLIRIMTKRMGLPINPPAGGDGSDSMIPYFLGKVAGTGRRPFNSDGGTTDWETYPGQYSFSKASRNQAQGMLKDYGTMVPPQGFEGWQNMLNNRDIPQMLGDIFRGNQYGEQSGFTPEQIENYKRFGDYINRFRKYKDADMPR